jgi:hexosaminidase
MTQLHLLPQPQQLTFTDGSYPLQSGKLISIPSPIFLFTAQRLQAALAQRGIHWQIVIGSDSEQVAVRLLRQSAPAELENAYQIRITPENITLIGSQNAVTLWHAALTLIQIIAQSATALPCLTIDDQPDFARRGVMLDISRDRVPKMETLYALIDLLAELEDQRSAAVYRTHLRLSEASCGLAARLAHDRRGNPRARPLLPRPLH